MTVWNLSFTAFIAYVFPDIIDFVSLIGGTVVTGLAVTMPGVCYYKLGGKYRGWVMLGTVIFTCIGLIATVLSLLDAFGVININE